MLRTFWYGISRVSSVTEGYESGGLSMMLAALTLHVVAWMTLISRSARSRSRVTNRSVTNS
jgi:hypothetical protein